MHGRPPAGHDHALPAGAGAAAPGGGDDAAGRPGGRGAYGRWPLLPLCLQPDRQVLFTITYAPDYAEVDIALLETRRHPVFSLTDWEYMYTGAMFHNRLMQLGGGVLHSSSLAWRGQGVAFSANSGTGKSTHTGLWKQVFGDEVEIINDDKPAIWFDEGQPMLCGTPGAAKQR